MVPERNRKILKIIRVFFIVAVLSIFICLGHAAIVLDAQNVYSFPTAPVTGETHSLKDGWTLTKSDGTSISVSLPYICQVDANDTLTLSHPILFASGETEAVMLDSHRAIVVVSTNVGDIYKFNTTSLNRQVRYTDYRIVALPEEDELSEISIKYSGMKSGEFEISEIYTSSLADARHQVIVNEEATIALLLFFLVAIIVLLFASIFTLTRKIIDIRFSILLSFFLLASSWGAADSDLLALTGLSQEFTGLICYFSLMALPLPLIHFYWISIDTDIRAFPVLSIVGAVNIVFEAIASSLGLFPLNSTIMLSHLLTIAYAAIAIVVLLKARKNQENKVGYSMLLAGCLVLTVFGVTAIILYWFYGGASYRNCCLTGFFLFGLILSAFVFISALQAKRREELRISELKLKEKLALTDAITGMQNRRAFEEYMKVQDQNADDKDCVLYMMDLNGLKHTNDQFGHSAGDELIIGAAQIIESVFGPRGQCFRIGGDEFAAVISDFSVSLDSLEESFRLKQVEMSVGSAWKYSIAIGRSHRLRPNGKRISISDWKQEADIQMYRNKLATGGGRESSRAQDLTEIINCVITTIEAKDIYTASHSERVRDLALAIGSMIGVSESTMNLIGTAAHMHDIGKIGIPDHILMKEGPLTAEEYDIIKQHSSIGAGIIGNAKGLQDVAKIVLHHHERWNGKGYPDGLFGDDIPLESRIIAIADSIDAMTSKRCYRDSLTIDQCHDEILRNSGVMYDPAIVSIVMDNWQRIVEIVLLHPKRL